jgi:hypothetical protein
MFEATVDDLWSTYAPDGLLGDMLDAATGGHTADRLERLGAWERIISWAQAAQVREIAGFATAALVDPAFGDDPDQVEASVNGEVGLMCRLSPRTAAGRVADSVALAERLPAVLAALSAGRISLAAARAIAEETATLAPEHLAHVQDRVLAGADRQTSGQIRAAARRAVARADADALRRRAERAREGRHVRMIPEPDGMATLSAYLPAADAVGIYGVLDECARRCGESDDTRTMDARRADALVDLIRDRVAEPDADDAVPNADDARRARRDRVATEVRVTVPLTTLLGLDQMPGELAGYGAIPGEVARELAGSAGSDATWRRLITDPVSGALLDYGTTRYRPPKHLAGHVVTRAQTCDFPSCRVPAHRCDLDHRVPYDEASRTGPTSADNLEPRCRSHHRLKASPGWAVTRNRDGTTTWRTPTGHRYRTGLEPVGEPARGSSDDDPRSSRRPPDDRRPPLRSGNVLRPVAV